MTDTVQCWLVERTYDDKGLIRLIYAPPDGSSQYVTEHAAVSDPDATAGLAVEADKLDPVEDGATRERYAGEAERMEARHDPDESV